jgi:hypothetical protein
MEKGIGQSLGQISPEGQFPNGIKVVGVIRFIRDHDYRVDLEVVAEHFGITPLEVAAAISFHASNFDRLQPLVLAGEDE